MISLSESEIEGTATGWWECISKKGRTTDNLVADVIISALRGGSDVGSRTRHG